MLKRLTVALVAVIPVLCWTFVKPVRFIWPSMNGVHCEGPVCVDKIEYLEEALNLYSSSLENLFTQQIKIGVHPTFVYCKSSECYKSFGGGKERAISYPYLGTVIAPGSWQTYITQHELVHWYQFETLGPISTMLKPEWFREGMAYLFSEAPVSDVPKHYVPLINKYIDWRADKANLEMMSAAEHL